MYIRWSTVHRTATATWALCCLLGATAVAAHVGADLRDLRVLPTPALDGPPALGHEQPGGWPQLVLDAWLLEALLASAAAATLAHVHRRRMPGWSVPLPALIVALAAPRAIATVAGAHTWWSLTGTWGPIGVPAPASATPLLAAALLVLTPPTAIGAAVTVARRAARDPAQAERQG